VLDTGLSICANIANKLKYASASSRGIERTGSRSFSPIFVMISRTRRLPRPQRDRCHRVALLNRKSIHLCSVGYVCGGPAIVPLAYVGCKSILPGDPDDEGNEAVVLRSIDLRDANGVVRATAPQPTDASLAAPLRRHHPEELAKVRRCRDLAGEESETDSPRFVAGRG